jgi:hypothetical protein
MAANGVVKVRGRRRLFGHAGAQYVSGFLLHGSAVLCGAQSKLALHAVIQITNGNAGHILVLAIIEINVCNDLRWVKLKPDGERERGDFTHFAPPNLSLDE